MLAKKLSEEDRVLAAAVGATTPAQSAAPSRRGSMYFTQQQSSEKLPTSILYIFFVNGCERFSFCGLQTILLLYFMHYFHQTETAATVDYHIFNSLYHFTPIVGAIVADGFIGRYSTILILSVIYAIGTLILSITSIPSVGHKELLGPMLGLGLIALGAGGTRPCTSTFCADQISSSNIKQLGFMFTVYYFVEQFAGLVARMLTPILRSDVQCFDSDCYPLAFAVPTFLMMSGIVLFIIGTPLYKRIPSKENAIAQFASITWRAMRNGISCSKTEKKEHFLHYADDKYSTRDINDVRLVYRVLVLFLPLTVFNALQTQKGSRWTLQASSMSGNLGPFLKIEPDQMQVLAPCLSLLLIPLFNRVIFPAAARFNWLLEPLQRIFLGLILTAISFVIAAILQRAIVLKANQAPVRLYTDVYNGYHCPISIDSYTIINSGNAIQYSCVSLQKNNLTIVSTCSNHSLKYSLAKDRLCPSIIVLSDEKKATPDTEIKLTPLTNPISQIRGVKQYALLRLVSFDDGNNTIVTLTPNKYTFNITGELVPTEYESVLETRYRIHSVSTNQEPTGSFYVERSGVYTVLLVNQTENKIKALLFEDVPPFTVHMLWQIIQYFFLVAGDVLVSITVLIFAYAEAPKRYKVVISSIWVMTSGVGDLIVIIVAHSHLATTQTGEFLFFAVFMAFTTYIFGILALHFVEESLVDHHVNDHQSEDHRLLADQNLVH
ncbi:unnamed protein product [Adineta ricciae]|uniref:Uncharacterized protein n=1 Tax=Adineta ricciae TaxID=249248 RepID=A0A814KG29_ADIRI|nr:unnamed protein product [Adineta ricciae]